MSEAILKAMRWYIMSLAAIVGSSAFIAANEKNEILPWLAVVLGFGVLYIMSYIWREFRGKILLVSLAVFLALTVLSSYAAFLLFMTFGIDLSSMRPSFMWALTVGIFGLPIMTFAFRRLD